MALQHAWFRTGIQRALVESQNGEAPRLETKEAGAGPSGARAVRPGR